MITDLLIKKLPLSQKRRELPDGKVSGLYLVMQPSGARSGAVRYRAAGLPKKLTLGSYPTIDLAAACKRALEALGDAAAGRPGRRQTSVQGHGKGRARVGDSWRSPKLCSACSFVWRGHQANEPLERATTSTIGRRPCSANATCAGRYLHPAWASPMSCFGRPTLPRAG